MRPDWRMVSIKHFCFVECSHTLASVEAASEDTDCASYLTIKTKNKITNLKQ